MRNMQRMTAVAGMVLATGAVLGMSATAASAATVQDGKSTVTQPHPGGHDHQGGDGRDGGFGDGRDGGFGDGRDGGFGDGRDGGFGDGRGGDGRFNGGWDGHRNGGWVQSWTVRTFDNRRACNFVGWLGEQRGLWDSSDCYRVGRGGRYVLVAHEYSGRHHHHR